MAKLTQLKRKITTMKRSHPWTLLTDTTLYSDKFQHKLRTNTASNVLKMYQAPIDAVRYFINKDTTPNDMNAYRLIRVKKGNGNVYYLEYQMSNAGSMVLGFDCTTKLFSCSIRDKNGDPVTLSRWDQFPELYQAATLLFLPYILELEASAGETGLLETIQSMEKWIDQGLQCSTAADFDSLPIDDLYYLGIVLEVMSYMEVTLSATGFPEEILDLDSNHPKGMVIAEAYPDFIHYVESAGVANRYGASKGMTIAEGIAQFSHYSAHRNWTVEERELIPQFKNPNEILMDEVVDMAYAITDTKGDKKPIVNLNWRGTTSYGKSYGTMQLACVLQMPLLKQTSDPDMEKSSFQIQILPRTKKIQGLQVEGRTCLDTSGSVPSVPGLQVPYLQDAVAYLATKEADYVTNLMENPSDFYTDALMDSDDAFEQLTGKAAAGVDPADVYVLYAALMAEHRSKPLADRVKELEDQVAALKASGKTEQETNFVTVAAPYLRAMCNGYMVEVQELSRIRDSAVAVSLNEFDRPGATMELMDGSVVRRHPDALFVVTDNVGYESCRPIDVSVRRRFGMIIHSDEMTEQQLKNRVKYNTGCTDKVLIDKAYTAWKTCLDYCRQNGVSNFCCSATELELLVQQVMHRGMDSFQTKLEQCVINKISDEEDVIAAVKGTVNALVGL